MNISKLKEIIFEHKAGFLRSENLTFRNILDDEKIINSKEIIVITGVRRSGKSSLLKLIARKIMENGIDLKNILYINFDDDRLINFSVSDFDNLMSAFLELNNPDSKYYIFLDEIQNVYLWEKWVNRMYEIQESKIFVTGSNSSLMHSDYSTLLTGRTRAIVNYPFSFTEHLSFKKFEISSDNFYDKKYVNKIKNELNNYYKFGGFPEVLINEDLSLLQQYFKDILYRDIIAKNGIKKSKEVMELALILSSDIASLKTYNSLQNTLKISLNSVKSYFNYFSDSYLFMQLSLFDYSIKKQIYNPKKNYCIDISLAQSVSFTTSANEGRNYENLIYLELLRRGHDVYYWKSSKEKEVDFIIKKGIKPVQAIQVSLDISSEETLNREIEGLLEANRELKIKDLLLLTRDEESTIINDGIEIKILPFWKYLISS